MLVDRGPKLDPMHTPSLCFLSSPIQNSDKYDFRTAHIKLVEDNAETIDKHENWDISLFKEARKIKELNTILNSGLKASKELQLF